MVKNAHVRTESQRTAPETVASDAKRLLDDPAFRRSVDATKEGIVRLLEEIRHDGSPETIALEQELCRTLRNMRVVVNAITKTVQGHTLRAANFQSVAQDTEAE